MLRPLLAPDGSQTVQSVVRIIPALDVAEVCIVWPVERLLEVGLVEVAFVEIRAATGRDARQGRDQDVGDLPLPFEV